MKKLAILIALLPALALAQTPTPTPIMGGSGMLHNWDFSNQASLTMSGNDITSAQDLIGDCDITATDPGIKSTLSNGNTVLYLDGSNEFYSCNSPWTSIAQPYWVIYAAKWDGYDASHTIPYVFDGSDSIEPASYYNYTGSSIVGNAGGNCSVAITNMTEWKVVATKYNGLTSKSYVYGYSGTDHSTASCSIGTSTFTAGIRIGSDHNGCTTDCFNGSIGELIVTQASDTDVINTIVPAMEAKFHVDPSTPTHTETPTNTATPTPTNTGPPTSTPTQSPVATFTFGASTPTPCSGARFWWDADHIAMNGDGEASTLYDRLSGWDLTVPTPSAGFTVVDGGTLTGYDAIRGTDTSSIVFNSTTNRVTGQPFTIISVFKIREALTTASQYIYSATNGGWPRLIVNSTNHLAGAGANLPLNWTTYGLTATDWTLSTNVYAGASGRTRVLEDGTNAWAVVNGYIGNQDFGDGTVPGESEGFSIRPRHPIDWAATVVLPATAPDDTDITCWETYFDNKYFLHGGALPTSTPTAGGPTNTPTHTGTVTPTPTPTCHARIVSASGSELTWCSNESAVIKPWRRNASTGWTPAPTIPRSQWTPVATPAGTPGPKCWVVPFGSDSGDSVMLDACGTAPTATATVNTPTETPTWTPTRTATPTDTPVNTSTPTNTPTVTNTPTFTVTPTVLTNEYVTTWRDQVACVTISSQVAGTDVEHCVTWPKPNESDALTTSADNYEVICSVMDSTTTASALTLHHVSSKSATQACGIVSNQSGSAKSGELCCRAYRMYPDIEWTVTPSPTVTNTPLPTGTPTRTPTFTPTNTP